LPSCHSRRSSTQPVREVLTYGLEERRDKVGATVTPLPRCATPTVRPPRAWQGPRAAAGCHGRLCPAASRATAGLRVKGRGGGGRRRPALGLWASRERERALPDNRLAQSCMARACSDTCIYVPTVAESSLFMSPSFRFILFLCMSVQCTSPWCVRVPCICICSPVSSLSRAGSVVGVVGSLPSRAGRVPWSRQAWDGASVADCGEAGGSVAHSL